MKVLRLPTVSGSDWWIIVHELSLQEGRRRKLRPIHVFTHLAKLICEGEEASKIGEMGFWLENKLFGVRYHYYELKKVLGGTEDSIYKDKFVRDYDNDQRVIAVLDGYLNSIYSTLELVSQMNRILYPSLPIGFRKQGKKFELYCINKKKWLQYFFDIRSELAHFTSLLPRIEKRDILISVTSDKNKCVLKRGKNLIPLDNILDYSIELFDLLDTWANIELKKVDQNKLIPSFIETGRETPLRSLEIKAQEILDLLK